MSRPEAPKPRNPVAVAMRLRYGKTSTKMKDRRAERKGSKKRDYMKDYE